MVLKFSFTTCYYITLVKFSLGYNYDIYLRIDYILNA